MKTALSLILASRYTQWTLAFCAGAVSNILFPEVSWFLVLFALAFGAGLVSSQLQREYSEHDDNT